MDPRPRRLELIDWLAVALFVVMSAYAIARGLTATGPGRYRDAEVMFIAGHSLASGLSPYDLKSFSKVWQEHFGVPRRETAIFPYPVTMFPVVYPLSLFSWEAARLLIDATNLAALAMIFWAISTLIRERSGEQPRWLVWAALCLSASCSAISSVLTLGQSSLIATAGISWVAVLAHNKKHSLLFGMAVLVASIKPQLSLVPVVAMMFCSSRRQVLAAVATSLLAITAILVATGWRVVPQFLSMLSAYREFSANGGLNLIGASLLASREGHFLATAPSIVFAAGATAVYLWISRTKRLPLEQAASTLRPQLSTRSLDAGTITGIILCSTFWMPLHGYDLVIYMLPLGWVVLQRRLSLVLLLPGLLAVARPNVLAAPMRNVVDAPLVASIAMLYCMAVAIYLALRKRPGNGSVTDRGIFGAAPQ